MNKVNKVLPDNYQLHLYAYQITGIIRFVGHTFANDLLGNLGRPQIIIEATEQVVLANSIDAPPVLTCSVIKDNELFPANQIRWKKGHKVLARTRVSGILVLDTATNPTIFGVYTCEAIINQSIAESSILIAERGIA